MYSIIKFAENLNMRIFFLLLIIPMVSTAQISYPVPPSSDHVDFYFEEKILDPYRPLEDEKAEASYQWIGDQNLLTRDYLNTIPFRRDLKDRLIDLYDYPRQSLPQKVGDRYIYSRNDGLQNQAVVYIMDELGGEARVLMDPNKMSEDGSISIGGFSPSKDGKMLAFIESISGSDWKSIRVLNVETGEMLSDYIENVKFSGITWKGNGFYYARYERDRNDDFAVNENRRLYYHEIGSNQLDDKLFYQRKDDPNLFFGLGVSDDQSKMFLSHTSGTSNNNDLYYYSLKKKKLKKKTIYSEIDAMRYPLGIAGGMIFIYTDENAPNRKIIALSAKKPKAESAVVVIPEGNENLEDASLIGNHLVCVYMKDVVNEIRIFDLDGNLKHTVETPVVGSISGLRGKNEDSFGMFTLSSFTYPAQQYKIDIATGEIELYRETEADVSPEDFVTRQVFFTSKDGTEVPMFLVHHKDVSPGPETPVMMYGYGGFNIAIKPGYSAHRMPFLENGGMYVSVNLRGGDEYGEEWHQAGMFEKKQNVFDDFIGAAEYLIDNGMTSKEKLAINGRSNGGLLVGAVMTQRPDLFEVAIPEVGVLDMLRYQNFTIGYAWAAEYGSSDNEDEYNYLKEYSPLHNLKEGVLYPKTMVMTAMGDDRVAPYHSYKFTATLQKLGKTDNPYLMFVEDKAGHGSGKPLEMQIEEHLARWSFIMYHLGMEYKK